MNTLPPAATERPAPSTPERKALALQRLETSRTLLIQRLFPEPDTPAHAGGSTGASLVAALLGRVQRDGWTRGLWRSVRTLSRRWWTRQPWHLSVELVTHTLAQEARPLFRRHPWACLGAAAAAGAALAWARPWVSRTVRQQTQGLHRQVGSLLWQQLAQAPVQLALAGALSTWITDLVRRQGAHRAPTAAPPASNASTAASSETTASPR